MTSPINRAHLAMGLAFIAAGVCAGAFVGRVTAPKSTFFPAPGWIVADMHCLSETAKDGFHTVALPVRVNGMVGVVISCGPDRAQAVGETWQLQSDGTFTRSEDTQPAWNWTVKSPLDLKP